MLKKPALLLLAYSALFAARGTLRADIGTGDAFPQLGTSIEGASAIPSTEGRVLLVDFWASWCAPCKASFPAYGKLNAEFSPRGLVIVAVSVDDEPAAYASFVKKFSPPFAVVLDQGHKLVQRVNVPTMPTCYLVDRRGRVRYVHAGYHGAETDKTLRREVELLLSEN